MADEIDGGCGKNVYDCAGYDTLDECGWPDPLCHICGQSINVALQVLYASRQAKDRPRAGIYTASEIMNERWSPASWWSLYRMSTSSEYHIGE